MITVSRGERGTFLRIFFLRGRFLLGRCAVPHFMLDTLLRLPSFREDRRKEGLKGKNRGAFYPLGGRRRAPAGKKLLLPNRLFIHCPNRPQFFESIDSPPLLLSSPLALLAIILFVSLPSHLRPLCGARTGRALIYEDQF